MDLKEYANDIKMSIDGTARGDVSIFLKDAEMRRRRILEYVNGLKSPSLVGESPDTG
jgi:hypothetical protein